MGKTCTAFFLCARGVVKRNVPKRSRQVSYSLPFRPPVAELIPFLAGQLVGGLAEPFNGFQFLPYGLHVDAVHLLLGGQQVDLTPPFLRGNFFAAGIQFFQIPGRRVIEDQFPGVALLEQFPFLRLQPGTLLIIVTRRTLRAKWPSAYILKHLEASLLLGRVYTSEQRERW